MAQQTAKEKAEELFQLFLPFVQSSEYIEEIKYKCKQCSLIAVDEIMKCTRYENQKFENDRFSENHWLEIKKEIEKL